MDGFKKCTSRPAPSVCRFLQQNRRKADVHRKADVRKTPTRDIARLPRGRAPRKRRARGANSHALIGEHKVYASVAESLDEKVEKRTHLGHAMPTLRASSSSSAEGALNTVYEIEGALENDGLVIRGLHAVLPPLTPSIWPVTNEALSDAR